MTVVVFGSINMDLVARTPQLPAAGQTLIGHDFFTTPGGKGANQAVACVKLGAPTRMIGRVGADVFGDALISSLQAAGVDTSGVIVQAGAPSGVAIITVDDAAENTIIVVPGANGLLGHDDVVRLEQALERANVLLLQLEIPLEAVVAAARVARKHGVTVVLDPAPAQSLPDELYTLTDIITPNETEAEALVGFPVHNLDDAERAARILCERGAQAAIIKMGSRGAYWRTSEGGRFEGAFQVHAIDTVAAGDAFNGGLATALSEGLPLEQAVRWGMAAGARSATRAGAQASMPAREEVFALLERFQLRC